MKEQTKSVKNASLRENAEEQIRKYSEQSPPLTEGDAQKLIHELEVHQIELEMQNEQLQVRNNEIRTISEKFSLLYDFAPAGYFTVTSDGTILDLNLLGARLLCRERSYLVGKNLKLFFTHDTLQIFNDFLQKIFENHIRGACEVQLNNNEKSSSFLRLDGTNADEESKCLISAIDITDKRKDIDLIKNSARQWSSTFDSMKDAVSVLDLEGHILQCNKAMKDMLKKPTEQIIEHHCWELIHGTQSPIEDCPVERMRSSLKRETLILQLGEKYFDVIADPIFDEKNKPIGAVHTISDITERRNTETQILRMNSVLFAISHINQLIAKECDEKLLFNKICDILHKTRGYVMVWIGVIEEGHKRVIPAARTGKNSDYLDEITITWDESDTGRGPTGTAIRTGKPQLCRDMATDPNFAPWRDAAIQRGYASSLVAPMIHNKRIFGTVNVYSDIINFFSDDEISLLCELSNNLALGLFSIENDKKRKEAEAKLKKYSENLEEQVKERTDELESFTYSVSHDLRAPLRAINGFSQIVIEDFADKIGEEGRKQLNVIAQNAIKMSELIDGLLTLSHLGRSHLSVSNINMKVLASEVIEDLKHDISKTVHFEIGELPDASGDSSMIRQVFVNLLGNAIKFTKNVKETRIEIGGYEENEENVYYVKDNGAGFDTKYADTLFITFHRLHPTEEFEGTGIGLALIKRIITRHGGRVWAEGETGQGAVFYFSLPKIKS